MAYLTPHLMLDTNCCTFIQMREQKQFGQWLNRNFTFVPKHHKPEDGSLFVDQMDTAERRYKNDKLPAKRSGFYLVGIDRNGISATVTVVDVCSLSRPEAHSGVEGRKPLFFFVAASLIRQVLPHRTVQPSRDAAPETFDIAFNRFHFAA